jgi:DNA primase
MTAPTLPFPGRPDFAQLKQQVSILEVLSRRGLTGSLRRRGHRLTGPCPVHGGDNPTAFTVDITKNVWFCFSGCGAGGDVIELVRRLDRVSHREAALWLSALPPATAPVAPAPVAASRGPFRPFEQTLYLDHHAPWLQSKGILPMTARAYEAGGWRAGGMLAGCIAVRLHSPTGSPWGYAGRRLVGPGGKWVFPPSFPKGETLYGQHRVDPACDHVVVVECPWGVMRLAQIGVPAVGLLGTSLSPTQTSLLSARRGITLMFDGDPAGRRAAREVARRLAPAADVKIAALPDGSDPDDLSDDDLRDRLA